jgi:hypothetical protein
MQDLINLLHNKWLWILFGGYWVLMAAVGALPMPEEGSGKFYKFTFAFLHGFSANINRAAVALKVPGAQ